MNWKHILYHSQDIAIALNCSVSTVEHWKAKNYVPATRFKSLVPVLAQLGHKLTTIEMGELNEQASHSKI